MPMKSLQLSPEFYKKTTIVLIHGEFNQYEGEGDIRALVDTYMEILGTTKQKDMILEFDTPYIGTVGINTLTELYQVVSDHGGKLILVNFPKNEMRYLEITGFIHYVQCLSGRSQLE